MAEPPPIPRRDLAAILEDTESDGNPMRVVIDEKITRVVKAVMDAGLKGSLTITVDVRPGKPGSGRVITGISLKSKIPEPTSTSREFFVHPVTGALQREDPKQTKLQFLDGGKPAPIRVVKAATDEPTDDDKPKGDKEN